MAHTHDHHNDHEDGQHAHGAGHHQHGDPATQGRAFLIAIGLNSVFVAIEFSYGVFANSTALVADAGHNLSDVLGLLLAWGAMIPRHAVLTCMVSIGIRRTRYPFIRSRLLVVGVRDQTVAGSFQPPRQSAITCAQHHTPRLSSASRLRPAVGKRP